MRVIDSLQLTAKHQVATPVDWKHGERCVVTPAVKTEVKCNHIDPLRPTPTINGAAPRGSLRYIVRTAATDVRGVVGLEIDLFRVVEKSFDAAVEVFLMSQMRLFPKDPK